ADQQTEDALAIASRGCRRLPQSRKVLSELQNQLFLFSRDTAHCLAFEMRQLGLQFKHPLHRVVPAFLERTGDEALGGVSLLITALCQVGFVAGTLDPSVPLRRNYSVTFLQVRAFSGKVESGGIPKEARIRFKIPTGTGGPVMNGEAIL